MVRLALIDDSALFRRMIRRLLRDSDELSDLEIFDYEAGQDAVDALATVRPDFVLCDVHMPGDDGLATLQKIRHSCAQLQLSLPTMVLISSRPDAATMAGASGAGAVDFMAKPSSPDAIADFAASLVALIQAKPRVVANAVLADSSARTFRFIERSDDEEVTAQGLILIGSSTGGPAALARILPELCSGNHDPIVIVQHLPVDFASALAQHFSSLIESPVEVARSGMLLRNGHVYLADGGWQLGLLQSRGEIYCRHQGSDPVGGHAPAVDVLFQSAVSITHVAICAVVLTGMGRDGSRGAKELRQAGAHVIAQDEATSVVWGMPGATVREGAADAILPLDAIAAAVKQWRLQR